MFNFAGVVICLVNLFRSPSHGYKILVTSADPGSHVMFMKRIASLFAESGHDVTLFLGSNVRMKDDPDKLNLKVLTFNNPYPISSDIPEIKSTYDAVMNDPSLFNQIDIIKVAVNFSQYKLVPLFMEDERLMDYIQRESFDYVVVDVLLISSVYIPYKLGIPYGLVSVECWGHLRRIPIMPSYVPPITTSYTDDMDIMQRFSAFWFTYISLLFKFGGEDISAKYVPERPPVSLLDFTVNASLCLQMKDNSIDFIRPIMPDVIPFAAHLARPAQPLNHQLKLYMDQSTQGVILVSFGTIVSNLPRDTLEKILQSLKNLKFNVIFKFPGEITSLYVPSNVRIVPWIPQNDLLAHPNLKAFVTHCGLNSYIESVYHAVPMLAVPYFWDQYGNAAIVKSKQFGDVLYFNDFTKEEMIEKINDVATNDIYREAIRLRSAIFRDVKASGQHDPVFWVEHVIKYGASHLRSRAYEMSMLTYFSLDIMILNAILLIGTVILICVIGKICSKVMCKVTEYKEKCD